MNIHLPPPAKPDVQSFPPSRSQLTPPMSSTASGSATVMSPSDDLKKDRKAQSHVMGDDLGSGVKHTRHALSLHESSEPTHIKMQFSTRFHYTKPKGKRVDPLQEWFDRGGPANGESLLSLGEMVSDAITRYWVHDPQQRRGKDAARKGGKGSSQETVSASQSTAGSKRKREIPWPSPLAGTDLTVLGIKDAMRSIAARITHRLSLSDMSMVYLDKVHSGPVTTMNSRTSKEMKPLPLDPDSRTAWRKNDNDLCSTREGLMDGPDAVDISIIDPEDGHLCPVHRYLRSSTPPPSKIARLSGMSGKQADRTDASEPETA